MRTAAPTRAMTRITSITTDAPVTKASMDSNIFDPPDQPLEGSLDILRHGLDAGIVEHVYIERLAVVGDMQGGGAGGQRDQIGQRGDAQIRPQIERDRHHGRFQALQRRQGSDGHAPSGLDQRDDEDDEELAEQSQTKWIQERHHRISSSTPSTGPLSIISDSAASPAIRAPASAAASAPKTGAM